MKRFLLCLLAIILTFSACGTLHTREGASAPSPTPTISPTPITPPDDPLLIAVCETLHFAPDCPITAEQLGRAEYMGRQFALVGVQNDTFSHYLVEYIDDTLIAWHTGAGYDANAYTTGYWPMYAEFGDTMLCWVRLSPTRTMTSNDGTQILDTTCETDFTAIRFTMSDGRTIDAPVAEDTKTNRLVLQAFSEWPVSAVPMVENLPITASEMRFEQAFTAQTA